MAARAGARAGTDADGFRVVGARGREVAGGSDALGLGLGFDPDATGLAAAFA